MNLSSIGSLLGAATSLLGGGSGGAQGIAGSLFGSGSAQGSGASSDPFAAIMQLTQDVDAIATSGLGALTGGALGGGGGAGAGLLGAALAGGSSSGLLGSIAGMLA